MSLSTNEPMKSVLHKFITEPLFDATEAMLSHLHIKFTAQSKTPLSFAELYSDTTSSPMPQALQPVVYKINSTYLIGAIDEDSLEGRQSDFDIQKPLDGKYQTMLVFAVDVKAGLSLTRGELATLTRGFNRMAPLLPVVVFVKNDDKLTLATCERSEYRQNWREGEKLGKVSILRDINCAHPHRGHIDILEILGDKAYPTFDELYKHWLNVFSSELLTRKFYTELSEWYAWVISSGEVKFPNDLSTTEDDAKYNHEAVIRLITRLIFVWFLKQKKLIPGEFFEEKAIAEKFIENFDPHSTDSLFYDPKQSKYYRLILQNLFFAMLNRPIKDEESGNEENRRFVTDRRYKGVSTDYNINNLLRYRSEFKEGGADRLLELANSQVPFLNGGLFECLDDKDNGMYYDGFSERKASLEQLSFPDYFFFGEEVGQDVDLSAWYDDKKKNHVHVHSLINILNHYNFTIEENTPLDQEVSLDPELLGKVFENLLASYNPETNTTARKQTGSFYTPRNIVKYMVDESLIAHLKRTCPALDESLFRILFDYSVDNFNVSESDRKAIMSALYNCKVLDPACGSGAFPMGILQQMVHALRKLDPTNEMWREFILDISLKKDKEAYQVEDEEERTRLRADIEQSFNRNVNDPDYARKLYLIENCIYGIDIQPIATQISKLRFFISLVAEQNPTNVAIANFGIRPLPNLEAKFVSANTLVPLEKNENLFSSSEILESIKTKLSEANHKIFMARRNAEKRKIKERIKEIRTKYASTLKELGTIGDSSSSMLASWDMFNQNASSPFFDMEWMFGINDGFDIVIANPPYVVTKKNDWPIYTWNTDLYKMFFERTCKIKEHFAKDKGVVCYITPKFYLLNKDDKEMRHFFMDKVNLVSLALCNPFDAVTENVITIFTLEQPLSKSVPTFKYDSDSKVFDVLPKLSFMYSKSNEYCEMIIGLDEDLIVLLDKIKSNNPLLRDISKSKRGAEVGKKFLREQQAGVPALIGMDTSKYSIDWHDTYLPDNHKEYKRLADFFNLPLIYVRRVDSCLTATIPTDDSIYAYNKNIYGIFIKPNSSYSRLFVVGWLNSKAVDFYYKKRFSTKKEEAFPEIQTYLYEQLPLPPHKSEIIERVESLVKQLLANPMSVEHRTEIDKNIYRMYGLSYNDILIIDPETTITREEFEKL